MPRIRCQGVIARNWREPLYIFSLIKVKPVGDGRPSGLRLGVAMKSVPTKVTQTKKLSIQWKQVPIQTVKDENEWNEIVGWYKENGVDVTRSKTMLHHWLEDNSYHWDHNRRCYILYATYTINYITKEPTQCIRYQLQRTDTESGNLLGQHIGSSSIKYVNDKFKERTGESIRKAFGIVDPKEDFKGFQYSPIIWTDKRCLGMNLKNIYKADVSSAYPYNLSKSLPDAHTAVRVPGRVEPTPEYPFAFYIYSNQLAIYNEFDTADYKDHFLNNAFNNYEQWEDGYTNRLHYQETDRELTILMKASQYTLKPEMEELYAGKALDESCKQTMVAFIGALSSLNPLCNNNNTMRHISSIVYARHIIRMMRLYDIIKSQGGVVESIATDSIIWASKKDIKVYSEEKYLGSFYLEYRNARARIARQGVYAIECDGKLMLVKRQGCSAAGIVKRLEDVDKLLYQPQWRFSKTGEFIYG